MINKDKSKYIKYGAIICFAIAIVSMPITRATLLYAVGYSLIVIALITEKPKLTSLGAGIIAVYIIYLCARLAESYVSLEQAHENLEQAYVRLGGHINLENIKGELGLCFEGTYVQAFLRFFSYCMLAICGLSEKRARMFGTLSGILMISSLFINGIGENNVTLLIDAMGSFLIGILYFHSYEEKFMKKEFQENI